MRKLTYRLVVLLPDEEQAKENEIGDALIDNGVLEAEPDVVVWDSSYDLVSTEQVDYPDLVPPKGDVAEWSDEDDENYARAYEAWMARARKEYEQT